MTTSDPEDDLGIGLNAGDSHYRAYVGPPEDYDLISAMTFGLLTTLGMRGHHRLIDIGCGSLRNGRLFIPYLNVGNYIGIEPNQWLVEEGIEREVGADLVRIKQPRFFYGGAPNVLTGTDIIADYAVAQSVFSHAGLDLIRTWLADTRPFLAPTAAIVATFLLAENDWEGSGWVYPDSVKYRLETIEDVARECGYKFQLLDWRHPRQTWGLFAMPEFDRSWMSEGPLAWNTFMARVAPSSPLLPKTAPRKRRLPWGRR